MVYFFPPRHDTGSSIYLKVFMSKRCRARVNESVGAMSPLPASGADGDGDGDGKRFKAEWIQNSPAAFRFDLADVDSIFSITLLERGKYPSKFFLIMLLTATCLYFRVVWANHLTPSDLDPPTQPTILL